MVIKVIAFVVLLIDSACGFVRRNQSFEIRGRFLCAGESVHRAGVQLWEDNHPLWKVIRHKFLKIKDEALSWISAPSWPLIVNFGRESEVSPYLIVFHRCDVDLYPFTKKFPRIHHEHGCWLNDCRTRVDPTPRHPHPATVLQFWRRFVVKIPDEYVNTGNRAIRIFDLGAYNLQFEFADEILLENCNKDKRYFGNCAMPMPAPFHVRRILPEYFIH